MLGNIKSFARNYFSLKQFAAATITPADNGTLHFKGCIITMNEGKQDFSNPFTCDTTLDLKKHLSKAKVSTFLVLDKNIVTKIVATNGITDTNELLRLCFPSISLDQLYYQSEILPNSFVAISIIRKKILDQIILELEKVEIFPLFISLNPLSGSIRLKYLDEKEFRMSVGDSNLTIEDGLPISCNYAPASDVSLTEHISVQYEELYTEVESKNLLLLLCLLKSITSREKVYHNIEWLEKAATSLKSKIFFERVVLAFLSAILFFAAVLTLWNTRLNQVQSKLNDQLTVRVTTNGILSVHESKLLESDTLMQQLAIPRKRATSFYIDRISMIKPQAVVMTSFEFLPHQAESSRKGKGKKLINKIVVSGSYTNLIELDSWQNAIRNAAWVEKVELLQIENTQPPTAKFVIEIWLLENFR